MKPPLHTNILTPNCLFYYIISSSGDTLKLILVKATVVG